MTDLIVEAESGPVPEPLSPPSQDLLTFLSFAAAERYGSIHPLSLLAQRLRRQYRVDLRPFWEFDSADPEDEQDRASLDRLWQAPGPLADCAEHVANLLAGEPELAAMLDDAPRLIPLLGELAGRARRAEAQGARLRLTYRL